MISATLTVTDGKSKVAADFTGQDMILTYRAIVEVLENSFEPGSDFDPNAMVDLAEKFKQLMLESGLHDHYLAQAEEE